MSEPEALQVGTVLPPLWHWMYFLPVVPSGELGSDGHPARGGFLPPISLPRRMFAGTVVEIVRPLRLGEAARLEVQVLDVIEKTGRSGKFAFVSVGHRITQAGELCISETRTIVYRDASDASAPPHTQVQATAQQAPW